MRMRMPMITILGIVCLCVHVATPLEDAANATQSEPKGNFTILKQDSGLNLSDMNVLLIASPAYSMAQATKFTAPYSGWKLDRIYIAATDGWNASMDDRPRVLPFAIEIRDANLDLLYHFSDTQLPYFTKESGPGMGWIDIPDFPVDGDFYLCFYGYKSLGLATELQNSTGNSYWYDKTTEILYPGKLPIENNEFLPINWVIWAAGK